MNSYSNNFHSLPLDKNWTDYLVSQPETGMGYQNVLVYLSDGTVIPGFIINSEELCYPKRSYTPFTLDDIVSIEVLDRY